MIGLSEVSDVCFKAFFISVYALHRYSDNIWVVLSLSTSHTTFVHHFFVIAAAINLPRCMYKPKASLLKYFRECFVKNYPCFNLMAFSFKFVSRSLLWSYCIDCIYQSFRFLVESYAFCLYCKRLYELFY